MEIKNAVTLLLTGIAIGTITGLLIAPDEGARTRRKWLKKAKRYKRDLDNKVSEYKDKATDLKDSIGDAAHNLKKRFA